MKEIFDNYKHLDVYFLSKQLESRYYGYKLYFDSGVDLDEEFIKKIDASIKFLVRNSDIYADSSTEASLFSVSIQRFYDDEIFMSKWKTFKENIKNSPAETLNCLGLALYQCVAEKKFKDSTINSVCLPKLEVKVFDYESGESIDDLPELCDKLLEIHGRVTKIKQPKYQIEWLLFLCTRCFRIETVKQVNGDYTPPRRCQNCGKRKFKAQRDSPFTKSIALQYIQLEYLAPIEDDHGNSQTLKMLDVKLLGDLVNTCSLTDNVKIVGVLKTFKKYKGELLATKSLYLEAVSVIKTPQPDTAFVLELNEDDNSIIDKIRGEPDIFSSLVKLFCPEIYGHDMVKAGLLLSLLGGSESEEIKGDINVLLFGDSGVGKSVLGRTCAQVAPKGVYVNLTHNTLLGVKVKPAKKKQKEPTLESGALVLADGGSCVIDKLRKLSLKQSQDLFEVMEDQSLYVQRFGINRSIAVKTSIVVASQPIDGKYNYMKTFEKNLNINKVILSRFDLIFLMLDHPGPSFEALKATQILNGKRSINDQDQFLAEKKSVSLELISKVTLQKYIAYARQIKAQLSEASAIVLKNYFVENKQKNYFHELLCHNKHFESLIRLTQARAKSELREEATVHDAEEVIKIHKFTIETLKKVILSSRSKDRYQKSPSEDIRLYFKKIIKCDNPQTEQ
ncbi:DNA helicase MCM8-like [Cotesia glomerata]|nr:DNA helicase MCM8-like [Cotesia glomerata]